MFEWLRRSCADPCGEGARLVGANSTRLRRGAVHRLRLRVACYRGASYRLLSVSREVFISYRRDDASSEAGRLADAIRNHFGHDSVFVDTSEIRFGAEWPEALRTAVENAAVVIAVIGPEWILARDEFGRRRIDDPDDWVRREIELGLEHGQTIIPLLVRHAPMPPAGALPPEIAPLSSRQAFEIRAESWTHDLELVQRELEPHLGRRGAGAALPPGGEPDSMFTADDFRAVALGFDSADMSVRNATADEFKEIAAFLELEEVLGFCRSRKTAERVGAAIALGVHIRSSKQAREDRRVLSALGELLTDGRSSFVRYRAAPGAPVVAGARSNLRRRPQAPRQDGCELLRARHGGDGAAARPRVTAAASMGGSTVRRPPCASGVRPRAAQRRRHCTARDEPSSPMHDVPQAHPFSLVGRFEGEPYFYVGTGFSRRPYPRPTPRRLFLRRRRCLSMRPRVGVRMSTCGADTGLVLHGPSEGAVDVVVVLLF